MPVRRTTKNGKPAFQWGSNGKKYTYKSGNRRSRNAARRKAKRQGRAIRANG